MDHLVKNCNLHYRSWKYWHSAMIHGKVIAIVTAYDVYRECCSGTLAPEWKRTPVSFFRFRERLACQMIDYSPKNLLYPGDEVPCVDKTVLDGATGRVCGFLDGLIDHERSLTKINAQKKTHLKCVCCGEQTYYKCAKCPGQPPLHIKKPEGRANSCFLNYHNTSSIGAWRGDWNIKAGSKRKDWTYPTELQLSEQARQTKRLHDSILEDIEKRQRLSTPEAAANNDDQLTAEDPPINYDNVI